MQVKPDHQSKESRWVRFVYLFATIVTIFAQLSAAAPLLTADAAAPTGAQADVSGMKLTQISKIDNTYTVEVSGPEPANGESFVIQMYGSGLVYYPSKSNIANGAVNGTSSGWVVDDSDTVNHTPNHTLTIKRDDSYRLPGTTKTHTEWPMKLVYTLHANESGVVEGGIQIKGSTNPPLVVGEVNTLALNVYNGGPTDYEVGQEVDLQASDQRMITASEVDVSNETITNNLTFDHDKTVALAKKAGYSVKNTDKAAVTKIAPDASSATVTTFAKTDGTTFYLIEKGQEVHVAWPLGNGAAERDAPLAFVAKAKGTVTMTPHYTQDDILKGEDGTALTLTIKDPPGVQASTLHFSAHSVAADDSGDQHLLANFPLFAIEANDTYAFAYNSAASAALATMRAGAKNKASDWGKAALTSGTAPAVFENFHALNDDGTVKTGSEKPFALNKTYALTPSAPVAGTTDRFKRISGEDYYMPDGVPMISLDSSGHFKLVTAGDGKAIPGQWRANKSTLEVALYKVKKIRVVDQTGAVVPDAKLTLQNRDGGTAMKADTDAQGTGELVPSDYDADADGPFYYAAGTQAFEALSLPQGYTQDIAFDMTMQQDDTLALTGAKNAAITDNGQVLTLTVHKQTPAESELNIHKVAKDNPTKALANATLHVEEVGNDTDALAAQDVTTDDNGDVKLTVSPDSTTTKRTLHITETQAPDGYLVGSQSGYYATWTKGQGFTAIGDALDATTTTSADGLASVAGGQLTLQDPPTYAPGGGSTQVQWQYIDAVEFQQAGSGTKIAGAQMPVLQENKVYAGDGLAGFAGLGGVVYNPTSSPSSLMTPDSGVAAGGAATNDGSMYLSTERADADGLGIVQGLWSQTPLVYGWEGLDHSTNGWILRDAIVHGTIPKTPAIGYQLLSPAQRQRATATAASDYYNLGGTINISSDGTTVTASNSAESNANDHANKVKVSGNTVQVQLFKVKHVHVIDTNGQPVAGAQLRFTNMTATTGADGTGELLPNDADNQPTTTGDNFVFPAGTQKLISATDASGKALDADVAGFGFELTDADRLTGAPETADASIQDNAQTIQVKVKAPVVIKLHKQDLVRNDQALAGATFKVWAASADESTAVTTAATDANGDTTATLSALSADGNYNVKEVTTPTGYQQDTKTHQFAWDPTKGVTGVASGETVIDAADGTLQFGDLKTATGGVGDNGTNGGTLTITKTDAINAGATVPDGAQFSVKQVTGGSYSGMATTKSGRATFDLGEATASERVFVIQETKAPDGYQLAQTSYRLRILPDGQMFIGAADDLANAIVDTHSADDVLTLNGHTLNFADSPQPDTISLKKVDLTDPTQAISGQAQFTLTRLDPTTNKATADRYTVTTNGSDELKIPVTLGITSGKFSITETSAPAGYQKQTETLYFQWDADHGVTAVGGSGMSTVKLTATIASDMHGNQVLRAQDDGTLQFADAKLVTNDKPLVIHKLGKVGDQATKDLEGAQFSFQEVENGTPGPATTVTSDADGLLEFIPPASTTTGVRIFKVTETAAPAGYLVAEAPYYVEWQDGKIVAYGKATADLKIHSGNYMNASLDQSQGILTITDAEQTATIKTMAISRTPGEADQPLAAVDVFISNPDVHTNGNLLTRTGRNGTLTVSASQVARITGKPAVAGEAVDLLVTVDDSTDQYTSPLPRIVRFTYTGGKAAPGFDVYNAGQYTASDSLKGNDNMFLDRQADSSTATDHLAVGAGNLVILFSQDTLSARSITDDGTEGDFLPGTQFTLTYTIAGKQYAAHVTVPESGRLVLKDPDTLLGSKAPIPVGQDIPVTLTQDNQVTKTVAGQTVTYLQNQDQATFTYNSARGYTLTTPGMTTSTNDQSTTSTYSNAGLKSHQATLFTKGGTDITYFLREQANALAFTDVPDNGELNLNFGNRELTFIDRSYALSDADPLAEYAGVTTPTTTLPDDASKVGISVDQQGRFANGWRVDLTTTALSADPQQASDTVAGASLTFDQGQGRRDGQAAALVADQHLNAALGDTTTMLQASGSEAGKYTAAWDLANVKLNVPAGQGQAHVSYRAGMTWTLIQGEP